MKEDLVNLHHARSEQDFPELKLEDDEFVELAFRRVRIGVMLIWAGVILGVLALTVLLIALNSINNLGLNGMAKQYMTTLLCALYAVFFVIGLVMTVVYNGNKFYVTNRRVIQIEQTSLFAKSKNIIDLVSIEDVSFKQSGLMQYIFKYGTLRMATIGDETTYTFTYFEKPTDELDTITHLVHNAKEKKED